MQNSHLRRAFELAKAWRGCFAFNPSVGAVVVKDDNVIGEGAHRGPGTDHAEVVALQQAGDLARGAELYVTLEPCNHQGRTPPCTEAIINAGITKVFYAYQDANKSVKGGGAEALQATGIEVQRMSEVDIVKFYRHYSHYCRTGFPHVTLKLAISSDRRVPDTHLTGPECDRLTHATRKDYGVILTTGKTLRSDDPQLNCRIDGQVTPKPVIILSRQDELDGHHQIQQTAESIQLLNLDNLADIKPRIGAMGYHDVWIEAGAEVSAALLKQGIVDYLMLYVCPEKIAPAGTPIELDYTRPVAVMVNWPMGKDKLVTLEFGEETCLQD